MIKVAGLWVDHHKAVVVVIKNGIESTREINSDLKDHDHMQNSPLPKSQDASDDATSEVMQPQQYRDRIDQFYDEIISTISDADSIWIFGPDEAKVELEDRFKHEGFGARIVGIKTIDKMTDQQIAEIVREHFLRKRNT